jgi:heptosyltransferase-3
VNGKILIIRGGAIGDFILTLPVFAALRAQLPAAELHVLGYQRVAQLAVEDGLAKEARSIDSRALAGFFARQGELASEWRDYFGSFAVIISYLYDPDGFFQANVARCSKAHFIVGPHRPDDTAGIHATDVLLKPLERLAIFDADPFPRLSFAPLASSPAPQLALHPGSGSERKNWPETRWAEFLQLIVSETDLPLLLVGGEAEGERLQRLASVLPANRAEVLQNVPLVDLARRLGSCRAFVGHDSGITHLSAAVGLPGLVLWGETARDVWAPKSRSMKVISSPRGLQSLGVKEVVGELQRLFRKPSPA